MKVQLLYFHGCPHVDAARAALREALAAEKLDLAIEEIDVEDPGAPSWARSWGSPTILVDGIDIAGQLPSAAASCRLYAGRAPDVATIRQRLAGDRAARGRVALPMIGAVTAAIAASACCVVPAVLALVGVSGAGFAAGLVPYRAYFLIATGVAIAIGFWFAYRRTADDCGCSVPRRRKLARVALWMTTGLALAFAAYPYVASGRATGGSSEAAAKATMELAIDGMDCKECTTTIANAIEKVPGVVSVSVDFDSASAVVRHDGRGDIARAAIAAVEDAGYRAKLVR